MDIDKEYERKFGACEYHDDQPPYPRCDICDAEYWAYMENRADDYRHAS